MTEKKWREELIATLQLESYQYDEPMYRYTSFRIGGPADLLIEAQTVDELARTVEYCQQVGVFWFLLGRGTNILVKDQGVRGVVLRLGKGFSSINVEGRRIKAGGAASLAAVAEQAARNNLTGLEFASGIPGSIGGALFMNAGAYGSEMQEVVLEAKVYRPGSGVIVLKKEELEFGYRFSRLQKEEGIILEVVLELNRGEEAQIRAKMAELNGRRKDKQPLEYPSAGSVFKRPKGKFAGQLIEEAGLKGKRVGNAQVSPKHAGFIVNIGNATAQEVLDLIELVRVEVHNQAGLWLEPEIRILGGE
ncbi:MAG TPA: UDP-N-acetylenolpyruvoylglucosamine reductase [Firmicutes bacterium]|nr:UDP-N-acetylenolpyruvoylglucosamine reductase [Bacillota bacterium]HBK68594.1 UDP-N-acetylenolpyruvoylglucosamine reductase [Bacillota bacterium]HBT16792.1 UDP-N-acetylenolpyruvoylglucosamine reductase [Bacillota bacterium]